MFYDNISMLTDLYQLTMMQGYFESDIKNKHCVFELFYRLNPSGNGYAIAAGLESAVRYVKNLKFTDDDIAYLKSLDTFSEEFLSYLKEFKFTGDILAVKEGSVVFPHEPLMQVKAPIIEGQLLETTLLNIVNHQSLIATKAARVCWAAEGETILEFGLRRAQGADAGLFGARAAVIAGCHATSNVLAGKMFNVPIRGTHAHSWVMSFDSELEAFRTYAKTFPDNCILLVDTYHTLESGVPNAIKVFSELKESGKLSDSYGIRLDSGDLSYLSKQARIMLDEAGFKDAVISASSDLDEYLISDLKKQGSKISVWGVGTNLITSKDHPAFGGVYKLVAESFENSGNSGIKEFKPKIKLSENPDKVTNPGVKKVYRLYDVKHGKIKADLICLEHEKIDATKDLTIFDPKATWKRMTLKANQFYAKETLIPIFINGECVYESPSVMEIREYSLEEQNTLWEEYKRFSNPHIMPVDLSQELFDLKEDLIKQYRLK